MGTVAEWRMHRLAVHNPRLRRRGVFTKLDRMRFFSGPAFICLVICVLAIYPARAEASGTASLAKISVVTVGGQAICNPDAAFSQVPGHPDYFIGRGFGIGSDCKTSFLALFKMDWATPRLVLQKMLLNAPVKTPSGIRLRAAYDPYITDFKGTLWIAFECSVDVGAPATVSTCMAPLSHDMSRIDLSRFTVPILGKAGPYENHPLVTLVSASAPTLLNFEGRLYLYWQVGLFGEDQPQYPEISRSMELEEDTSGRLWGKGSGGKSVLPDDRLTTLVQDVVRNDLASNHVAAITYAQTMGHGIIELSSIGGTAGGVVCHSTHEESPGCWRIGVSFARNPLAGNTFGEHQLATSLLPGNVASYPRFVTDPAGKHFLMGLFVPPHGPPRSDYAPPVPGRTGLILYPLEPGALIGHQSR